jgi:hypothetical protein
MPNSPFYKRSLILLALLAALYSAREIASASLTGRWSANLDPSLARRQVSPVKLTLSAPHTTISWDERDPERERFELPLLYLHREYEATAEAERTLEITISDLVQSTELQIELVSQHTNVVTGERHKEKMHFAPSDRSCATKTRCTIRWTIDGTTPSDLYTLRVRDAAGNTIWENSNPNRPDFVALDTWTIALGAQRGGSTAGYAARVTYATLFPFAKGQEDLANRLSPEEVRSFVAKTFMPIVEETWRIQVDEWGFGVPLHADWDVDNVVEIFITTPPFALFDGTGTYSVSVMSGQPYPERRIWWFSSSDSFQAYDTLENAYKVVFAHEFFHLVQWNVLLTTGRPTKRWQNLIIEAQAKFAASVQYPELEVDRAHLADFHSEYSRGANRFLTGRLNVSYRELEAAELDKYDLALYWRFLYEQFHSMEIVRAALEEMTRYHDPDIVTALGPAMDAAFERVAGPFRSFEESLVAFARSNYALRLDNGRCTTTDASECQGLYYDPYGVYIAPPLAAELKYDGDRLYSFAAGYALSLSGPASCAAGASGAPTQCADGNAAREAQTKPEHEPLTHRGSLPTSYGMDFLEIHLAPTVRGQIMSFTFESEENLARFNVELWMLSPGETGARAVTSQPRTLSGSTTYRLPAAVDKIALVITRLDPHEIEDSVGNYTITLGSGMDPSDQIAEPSMDFPF